MRQHPAKALALAVCGCTALWSVQAAAQGSNNQARLEQMQQQIQQLQQQVRDMKAEQRQQKQQRQKQQPVANQQPEKTETGPEKSLNIGGSAVVEGQLTSRNGGGGHHQHNGGDVIFDYFGVEAKGQYGNLTFAAEQRFSPNNFADSSFLHYGWAAYSFKDHHRVKGGFVQVPFGNYPTGYNNFWGSLAYFTGFTDNQAAGADYTYTNGPWRLDVAAFKNDDLGQHSLYGSNPFEGYQQVNGGAGRLAYTFDGDSLAFLGHDDSVDVSLSARGGQLDVGDKHGGNGNKNGPYGNRWAVSAAADASLGLWDIQGQFVDYRYNIPRDRNYAGQALPYNAVRFENYGSTSGFLPARGQLYALNIARKFPVENLGPIDNFTVYNDYGFIHSGVGSHARTSNSGSTFDGMRIGKNIHEDVLGAAMYAGPVKVWADVVFAKNDAVSFMGENNNNWHTRFNLAAGIYFDSDVIK